MKTVDRRGWRIHTFRPMLPLCLFFLLISIETNSAYAQELPFTHYTTENEVNPLPSADVRSIYQDRLGYLWMVVYSSGLLRYDGHSVVRYTTENGLPGLDVREVLEDQYGKLWVATEEGLVVSERPLAEYIDANRIRFSSTIGPCQLIQASIVEHHLARDSEGTVWVGTRQDGVVRYHRVTMDSVTVDTLSTALHHDGKNRDVRAIIALHDGSVCVSIVGGSMMVWRAHASQSSILGEANGLPQVNTDVLFEDRFHSLYGGCANGLVWRLPTLNSTSSAKIISDALKSRITCINEVSPGVLMVGSEGSGIAVMPMPGDTSARQQEIQTPRRVYTKQNGLLGDNISSILRDKEDNVWITQVGGISKLRSNYRAFVSYTAEVHGSEKPQLPNSAVNVIIPRAGSQELWLGTSGGGVTHIRENGESESIQAEQGLRSNWVNGLAFDGKGRLWIGTTSGINCLALDNRYPPPQSPRVHQVEMSGKHSLLAEYENTTIYACKVLPLRVDPDSKNSVESVWMLGYQHLYCFTEGAWYVFRMGSGLPATFFDAVAVDSQGVLWIGTRDAGLYRSSFPLSLAGIQNLKSSPFASQLNGRRLGSEITAPVFEPAWTVSNGAPSNQIETITWHANVLWAGTPEGLVALERTPVTITSHFTKDDGLKGNDVTSLAYSPVTGSIWIGTNGGLAEVDPLSRKVRRVITKQDGLVDNEVWFYGSVTADDNGTIYFGTSKGLTLYSPQFDKRNELPPVVRFGQTSIKESQGGNNEIVFAYAALSFANEKLVRYRTQLVGYDREWSEEKPDVTIRYTNLPAFLFSRSYTFQVVACNNSGIWTPEPLQYSFLIQPPWWFRWWWVGVYLITLAVVMYAYSKHRLKRLEQRSRELERTVEERTHEIKLKAEEIRSQAELLAQKNNELEVTNNELVRTQEQLIMQEKLASLGALTAGIAHEIKNPLNFVNNFAELSLDLTRDLREDIDGQKERIEPKILTRLEETISDLEHNAAKINEHGKRADSIVRGMLMHSRGKSGERMQTDINTLLNEHALLAYHGFKAQEPDFNITINTDFDNSVGQIEVIPQDLSRVFLNIVNNACYATSEKKKVAGPDYVPVLALTTRNLGGKIEVRIKDNGPGIPKDIIAKVFDPFFTTKPTGKGTGLGLSLSYDIIVKQHRGELIVESQPGNTEFIIRLPKQ